MVTAAMGQGVGARRVARSGAKAGARLRPQASRRAAGEKNDAPASRDERNADVSRRELMLKSPAAGGLFLGALFTIGAAPRPKGLGVTDYGSGVKSLGLCPTTPNCISTAEAANDLAHFVPGWNYAPQDGRGLTQSISQDQAMQELVSVVEGTTPDGFTPKIVEQTSEYLYVEYESPTFGFIDDVEFWFPGKNQTVEYRSASRIGESDGDINRKRIKALREELEKKGWRSVGF
mmetsp:Transcript_3807/g.9845  ORF Transcript_3807/g.9845 Transcript_3807/m.9845 type:complete len:233 (+) Transcript_3807:63-761(+)